MSGVRLNVEVYHIARRVRGPNERTTIRVPLHRLHAPRIALILQVERIVPASTRQREELDPEPDVFDVLFSSEGSEVYLRPASAYIRPGAEADFPTVLEAARRRGETAIGWRLAAQEDEPGRRYGVRLNPSKTERIRFTDGDRIVVLAES